MAASGAGSSGELGRVRSRWSRARISATTAADLVSLVADCWRKRRSPRTSGAASRKIFTSASGNTLVPMSRPSITTPPAAPICRCRATIQARTPGCTETFDAASVTSRSRMRALTSMPSSSTRLPSIVGCKVMCERSASATSAVSFSKSTSSSTALSASARYMAPVSILM